MLERHSSTLTLTHTHTYTHVIHSCIRLVLRALQQKPAVQSGMFQCTQRKRGMDDEKEEQKGRRL